jgi:Ran GTPase-activating protein (RanGAP) involved in mRNA processing and transport
LDLSNIPLDFKHLDSFIYVLDGLSSLQQLILAYYFTQATLGPHGK